MMVASERCVAALKAFEGLRLEAYRDVAGVWTIGYGSTQGVEPGQRITAVDADRRLRLHVALLETSLRRELARVWTDYTQGQFDALTSFAYNLGLGSLLRSTLWHRLAAGDLAAAAAEFPHWCLAGGKEEPGLLKRRLAEQSWFLEHLGNGIAHNCAEPQTEVPDSTWSKNRLY